MTQDSITSDFFHRLFLCSFSINILIFACIQVLRRCAHTGAHECEHLFVSAFIFIYIFRSNTYSNVNSFILRNTRFVQFIFPFSKFMLQNTLTKNRNFRLYTIVDYTRAHFTYITQIHRLRPYTARSDWLWFVFIFANGSHVCLWSWSRVLVNIYVLMSSHIHYNEKQILGSFIHIFDYEHRTNAWDICDEVIKNVLFWRDRYVRVIPYYMSTQYKKNNRFNKI